MRITVTIGPVPTASAVAWLGAADETLRVLREGRELAVSWDVIAAFEAFVDAWKAHAALGLETFLWEDEVEDSLVRTIGLQWARIVSVTRSGRVPSLSTAPPEAAAFYDALASAITSAMARGEHAPMADAFAAAVPAFDRVHAPVVEEATRVMIVDDDQDIRLLLRIWLEGDPGFEVAGEASDGHAAIEVARLTRPHVAVLDVQMPGMSGIQALPLIRKVAPDCAVVMFSANGQRCEALAAGALTYVSKDVPMRRVLEAIRGAAAHVRGVSSRA
jgi:CheY-like chemotaxis protein